MALRDITDLMNTYRECSRNLWNTFFSSRANLGASLDVFRQIRSLLFESLVVNELLYEEGSEGEPVSPPILLVVPRGRSLVLIQRPSSDGNGYWDAVKDMAVGPDEIDLRFIDYFDFSQIPIMDHRFYRCVILRFPSQAEYEGREALIEAFNGRVFHDE